MRSLGPSGVGKSTLVNALVGEDLLATGGLRADGSGRHTTTRRQLVLLEDGGLLVDNPGMREVHLWLADEGLEDAFPDIVELESQCRFRDCSHESEPGCAIRRRSPTVDSPPSAGGATAISSRSSPSSKTDSPSASAPAPDGSRREQERGRR